VSRRESFAALPVVGYLRLGAWECDGCVAYSLFGDVVQTCMFWKFERGRVNVSAILGELVIGGCRADMRTLCEPRLSLFFPLRVSRLHM
jgi:hypothetical protein